MAEEFDVIVVGGGPAGENVAWYARDNGLEVALVERELVGGECSFWACMPSKALLRPGEVLAAARRVPAARGAVTGVVDAEAALRSRDAFASNWDDVHQVAWLEGTGTTLVRGHGRLAGDRVVEVSPDHPAGAGAAPRPDGPAGGGVRRLTARLAVVVATGSTAAMPPIDGLAQVGVWDSRAVTSAKTIPRRLAVIGGGVVGVEMAQAFRRLGVEELTILQRGDRLLRTEEPFVGPQLADAFAAEGIDVRLGVQATRVRRAGPDAPVVLGLDDDSELQVDELLVAVGRRPSTGDLGLKSVGLTPGRTIEVDDHLRATGVDAGWLYAVGDVNGRALLTHHGKYQGRIVADHLAGKDISAWADDKAQVRVVFTDPQVASVGLTAAQAADRGIDVQQLSHEVSAVAGGALIGEGIRGTAHLVVDRYRRTIIGATFTGPAAGEMLHAATIAVVSGTTLDQLWHAVPAFPTMSEVWLRLLEADRGIS